MTTDAAPTGGPLAKILTPSRASGLRTSATTLASSLLAVLIALTISAALLALTGKNPIDAYSTIIQTGASANKLLEMMRRATPLIFSAVAVAVGFKMNIFNIGVQGQYLFAALIAAEAGSHLGLPLPIHIAVIMIVAVVAGAAWASIAAYLKVSKNVHEVISTIMLNYVALSVIQWLFENFFRDDRDGGLNVKTTLLPDSARMPDIVDGRLNGMFIVALIVVAIFWLVVYKSTFGFKLRASGFNATAASTAGISARKMTVIALLISGGVSGFVALERHLRTVPTRRRPSSDSPVLPLRCLVETTRLASSSRHCSSASSTQRLPSCNSHSCRTPSSRSFRRSSCSRWSS